MNVLKRFDLTGKTAVVTGGSGVLGAAIAEGLAAAGARVAITGRTREKVEAVASAIQESGGTATGYVVEAPTRENLHACCEQVRDAWGRVDILVNSVGGNTKEATTSPEHSFFDLNTDALRKVVDLNLLDGAITPCQVFGEAMAELGNGGSIINISSMAAMQPLTRIPGYSAAKAAVDNFTQWLAVNLAQECDHRIRVNAIAPGFFLTEQNRFLLLDEASGHPTDRGKSIIDHTPMGRYGSPEDLVGAALWLASDASLFVTGTVIAVDGGFSAYAGV